MHTRIPVEPKPDWGARAAFMRAICDVWTPSPLQSLKRCAPAFDEWMRSASKVILGAGAWRHLETDNSPEAEAVRVEVRSWWRLYPLPEIEWVFDVALLTLWAYPDGLSADAEFKGVGLNGGGSFIPKCNEQLPNGGWRRMAYEPGKRTEFRRWALRVFRRELTEFMDSEDARYGQAHLSTATHAVWYAQRCCGIRVPAIVEELTHHYKNHLDPESLILNSTRAFARRAGLPLPSRPSRSKSVVENVATRDEKQGKTAVKRGKRK